jgi:hypothetical protein
MVPLLGLLGWQLDYQPRASELNGKLYAISHRAGIGAQIPVHLLGGREPAGLDRKPTNATLRMSAHAVVQEYLNLTEQLYGLVSNGHLLRLLRDSSRLVRLSFLEFDLDRIFSDGLFADFAVLYRLLHASRLPQEGQSPAACWMERYHQDSLDSGARIRDGLSRAVEEAILSLGNGFLSQPHNEELRRRAQDGSLPAGDYYRQLLRLIYRLLFLMVIEERDLVFGPGARRLHRDYYARWYSLARLRRLSEKRWLADMRHHDLWLALTATFRLFEDGGPGAALGLKPLAGDLFGHQALGLLGECRLGNDVLLTALRSLGVYRHPDSRQLIRVNYAALNVEEFGSVYEGLLEFAPVFLADPSGPVFNLVPGDERASTGSHYTPDDLVQPLIKHSLDHQIQDCLKTKEPASALLGLRVADIACGSGHILLAAARRIATELARAQTGDEQPSPAAFRAALREVIRHCIYGVDLNPLAVELCKVALWLEAHSPGEPLNFLDHHIKCGNSVMGFARAGELDEGVPDAAFTALDGDDKAVASALRKRNKQERKLKMGSLALGGTRGKELATLAARWRELAALPEETPAQVEAKKARHQAFWADPATKNLHALASLPLVPFFTPKTRATQEACLTDGAFRPAWSGGGEAPAAALQAAEDLLAQRRLFHWFLEFPEILERGGFDCILGNPPFLGGQHLSGTYGASFLTWVKCAFAPAGSCDLSAYFFRRVFNLLRPGGRMALLATNTIAQGGTREGGLDVILAQGGSINYAVRSMKWPGVAALEISQVALLKGKSPTARLDGRPVGVINAYLSDETPAAPPVRLEVNAGLSFQGSIVLGMGFVLEPEEAQRLLERNPRNRDVLFPYLNGEDLNSRPDQSPSRWVINFHDWPLERAQEYEACFKRIEETVKPERQRRKGDGTYALRRPLPEKWWIYAEKRPGLYRAIAPLERVLVISRVSQHVAFSWDSTDRVFADRVFVFATSADIMLGLLSSSLHESWARTFSSTLESRLNYAATDCFETFPFPQPTPTQAAELARLGQALHDGRRRLQLDLGLGLTKVCNLFHAPDLAVVEGALLAGGKAVRATYGIPALEALARIEVWRALQVELDQAVAAAYGWGDLALEHGFHAQAHLPEHDRIRFTVCPAARKELLRRLLALNHQRAAEEEAARAANPAALAKGKGRGKKGGPGGGEGVLI